MNAVFEVRVVRATDGSFIVTTPTELTTHDNLGNLNKRIRELFTPAEVATPAQADTAPF